MTRLPIHVNVTTPVARLAERIVYQNRFATVCDDDVRLSSGSTSRWIRIVQADGHPSAAALPVAAGHVGMVHVYRYPVGAWEWGLPRGRAHGPDPEVTARAELTEELGAPPARLDDLGWMWPDSAILATVVRLYVARYDSMPATPLDTDEVAAVRWIPIPQLRAAIAAGEIMDGFTLATAARAICRGLL